MSIKSNILLVANWESNVGFAWWLMENFWITIASHFEKDGMSSHLAYPKITRLPEPISNSGIIVHECDFQNHVPGNLRKIRRLIKANDIKFIYLSDYPSYSAFYILLRLWGIRKIIVHDHTPGERSRPGWWRRLIKHQIQRMPFITADHFIAVTEFVHQRHLEVNCIPGYKCSVARNGIDPIEIKEVDMGYSHRQFNIPADRKIIVTTGRASHYKGIDFFIECADELINRQGEKTLHFLFCGDGPNIEEFKSLVSQKSLDDFFSFAGKRTDVREILPSCSIGFHAAKGEVGYSLSILEYMSAGLVAIVPDNPSTSLATTHMENGILYKSGDITTATEAIKTALDEKLSEPIKREAIRTVAEEYSIRSTNQKLIDILEPLICQSSGIRP